VRKTPSYMPSIAFQSFPVLSPDIGKQHAECSISCCPKPTKPSSRGSLNARSVQPSLTEKCAWLEPAKLPLRNGLNRRLLLSYQRMVGIDLPSDCQDGRVRPVPVIRQPQANVEKLADCSQKAVFVRQISTLRLPRRLPTRPHTPIIPLDPNRTSAKNNKRQRGPYGGNRDASR
jgi:hypothetical protein